MSVATAERRLVCEDSGAAFTPHSCAGSDQFSRSSARRSGASGQANHLGSTVEGSGVDVGQLKEIIRYAFDHMDLDGDGHLSEEEFLVAYRLLGGTESPQLAAKAFRELCGGKDAYRPTALDAAPLEHLRSAMQSALRQATKDRGLDKLEHILTNIWRVATEDQLSSGCRWRSLSEYSSANAQEIISLFENLFSMAGIGYAFVTLAETLLGGQESILTLDDIPLLILCVKFLRDTSEGVRETMASNLSRDEAVLFASVFKPAGFSLFSFRKLCDNGHAKWSMLRAGESIPLASFGTDIPFVASGTARLESSSAVPGLSENCGALTPGAALSPAIGDGQSAFQKKIVAQEDVLLLTFETEKLEQFFKVSSSCRDKFHLAVARSASRTSSRVQARAKSMAGELPSFFRDGILSLAESFQADRATLWIHDPEQAELWTIFLHEEGDLSESPYVAIADDVGLAGRTLQTGQKINIPDCYQDERFHQAMDKKSGYRTGSMLCLPIHAAEDGPGAKPIGVLQLLNKVPMQGGGPGEVKHKGFMPFTAKDEEFAEENLWALALLAQQLRQRYSDSRSQLSCWPLVETAAH